MAGVLFTGASGFLGGELLDRLLPERPGARFFLLTRDPERLPARFRTPRFTILQGDLTRADMGISARQIDAMQRTLTEIVHCAAATRFDMPLDAARRANVRGTETVLRFAENCPRLTKFLHLSTACVAGRCAGVVPEAMITHTSRFSNAYQQSKYEAERLVAEYASSLPLAIVRISSIIGDSRTGAVKQFNYVHHLLKLFPQLMVPIAPYDPKAIVDLVASDWVADSLAYLFLHRFRSGSVYHLCAGGSGGITVDEVIAETHRIYAHHPSTMHLVPIRLPRLATLSEWDDFVDRQRRDGSHLLGELLRVLHYFVPHLAIPQVFENQQTLADLATGGITLPKSRDVFAGVVRWCLDTKFGTGAGEHAQ